MMNPTPDTPGKGSFWHFYIAVDNADECATRASSLGGSVIAPLTRFPTLDEFALWPTLPAPLRT